MKKSIFDLSFNEGKELEKKVRKTSYYKQYLGIYVGCLIIVLIPYLGFIFDCDVELLETSNEGVYLMLFASFVALFTLIFGFKRFNLIKQYYDEKVNNKE